VKSPGVAVVIPAFNHARYLPEAIDSVLAQDYPSIDFLVVDDGSTDETRSVLEGYASRVRWFSRENRGQSATLNEGWLQTNGDILLYLGADDVLLPGAIGTVVSALQEYPSFVGAYGDYLLIDDRSQTIRRVSAPPIDLTGMLRDFTSPPAGTFFRRSTWECVGGWDESLSQVPDRDFLQRALLHGPLLRLREPLAAFRVHAKSQTFRPRAASLAAEPIVVVDRFFQQPGLPVEILPLKQRARAMARVVTARHDLRRRDWVAALRHLSSGVRLEPRIVLAPRAWRFVANGLRN